MKNIYYLLVVLITYICSYGQNKISFEGTIAHKNGDVVFIKNNQGAIVKELKVDSDGKFKDNFEIKKEGFYMFFDGKEYTELYLKNGYDLKMKLDAEDFDKTVIYKGKGEKENNFLADKIRNQITFEEKLASIDTKDAFTALLDAKKANEDKALQAKGLDADFVKTMKGKLLNENLEVLDMFNDKLKEKELIGKPSPTFDFENHKGGTTSLESLKGKYVYIDVWATWCGPCRAEIPHLQKIEEKYHDKNIAFVSISIDEKKDYEKWKKMITDKNMGGIQLIADKNWMSDFVRAYGINSIPRFILIDPAGNVVNANAARPSEKALSELLDTLLK